MSDTVTFEDRIKALVLEVLHSVGLVPDAAPVEASPPVVAATPVVGVFPVADQTPPATPVVGV